MSQPVQPRLTVFGSIRVLLTLSLLTICLPLVADGQEQAAAGPELMQPTESPALMAAVPSRPLQGPTIEQTPETKAKVAALISEVLEPEASMDVTVNRSKLIRTKVPVTRFAISDPKTLDVVQFNPTEFELLGLKAGRTSLTLWFGEHQALRYMVNVAPDTSGSQLAAKEYKILQDKINELFPNSMVQLFPVADKLIVRGQAKDAAEAAQIISMLSEGRGGNGAAGNAGRGATGNQVNLGQAVTPIPGSKDIPAHSIISLLNVPGEQQVMLKVRIAELSRTAMRQMTAQLKVNNGNLALNTGSAGISAVFSSVLNPQDLSLALTAVASTGYTKILAEPNLVTLNGQSASFLAGGEFPVPTAVGIGGISGINTQFRTFGTEVSFTPTIIDKDRIRLKVTPTFSQMDAQISVDGIPGLKNRTVTTTVDLRAGQWLAIAGLLQDGQQGAKSRVPFVGDIPVVGTLFGHTQVQRDETELIILVSPELVHPTDARETPLILPGMEIAEPGDVALFLGGAYVAKYGQRRCAEPCAPPACGSAPCASQPEAAEANRQATRDVTTRPDYQRSEKYYLYGSHGVSQ
jgi:pilus assembly protein CpaC